MFDIITILSGLSPTSSVNIRVLSEIIKVVYCICSGGVTMKNISRWTSKGCSYRTIQCFFSHPINWLELNILFFQAAYFNMGDKEHYLLAFDETVEDKVGKKNCGIGWFYIPIAIGTIACKVIRSVSNHVVSLIDTKKETSYILTHQLTVKPLKNKKNKENLIPLNQPKRK